MKGKNSSSNLQEIPADMIAGRIWDPCGQLQTWGTKTQTKIQHGGRGRSSTVNASSTSACEENLVKKSHGNEGKWNFTYLDTLKS